MKLLRFLLPVERNRAIEKEFLDYLGRLGISLIENTIRYYLKIANNEYIEYYVYMKPDQELVFKLSPWSEYEK